MLRFLLGIIRNCLFSKLVNTEKGLFIADHSQQLRRPARAPRPFVAGWHQASLKNAPHKEGL